MLVTTTLQIDYYEVLEYRGVVRGLVVRAPTIMQGFWGGIKNLWGGNIGSYTDMCEQARSQAYDRMVKQANQLGANAVLGMRYDSSQISSGRVAGTEVICYGTAVVLQRKTA